MKAKVAVIAGTPVDTAMGVEFLKSKDAQIAAVAFPANNSPREQHLFQLSAYESKHRRMSEIFDSAEAQGIRDFFIYCNSLSGAFDFDSFAAERGVNIYTPLQVYRQLGQSFDRAAVIAANNQSTAGIERSLFEKNPNVNVMGLGWLELVYAVENRLPPEKIIRDFALDRLCRFFEDNGAECLILGCTHFPYFQRELEKYTALPVINPADMMYEMLINCIGD